MDWNQTLVLLQVVDYARDHPQLKALHDQALAELAASIAPKEEELHGEE